jgi:hypothetical protein
MANKNRKPDAIVHPNRVRFITDLLSEQKLIIAQEVLSKLINAEADKLVEILRGDDSLSVKVQKIGQLTAPDLYPKSETGLINDHHPFMLAHPDDIDNLRKELIGWDVEMPEFVFSQLTHYQVANVLDMLSTLLPGIHGARSIKHILDDIILETPMLACVSKCACPAHSHVNKPTPGIFHSEHISGDERTYTYHLISNVRAAATAVGVELHSACYEAATYDDITIQEADKLLECVLNCSATSDRELWDDKVVPSLIQLVYQRCMRDACYDDMGLSEVNNNDTPPVPEQKESVPEQTTEEANKSSHYAMIAEIAALVGGRSLLIPRQARNRFLAMLKR